MSKQNPRPSVRKLSGFDICSIPKKPPAPSLDRRRCQQEYLKALKGDLARYRKGVAKRELTAVLRELAKLRYDFAKRDREEVFAPRAKPVNNDALRSKRGTVGW